MFMTNLYNIGYQKMKKYCERDRLYTTLLMNY